MFPYTKSFLFISVVVAGHSPDIEYIALQTANPSPVIIYENYSNPHKETFTVPGMSQIHRFQFCQNYRMYLYQNHL